MTSCDFRFYDDTNRSGFNSVTTRTDSEAIAAGLTIRFAQRSDFGDSETNGVFTRTAHQAIVDRPHLHRFIGTISGAVTVGDSDRSSNRRFAFGGGNWNYCDLTYEQAKFFMENCTHILSWNVFSNDIADSELPTNEDMAACFSWITNLYSLSIFLGDRVTSLSWLSGLTGLGNGVLRTSISVNQVNVVNANVIFPTIIGDSDTTLLNLIANEMREYQGYYSYLTIGSTNLSNLNFLRDISIRFSDSDVNNLPLIYVSGNSLLTDISGLNGVVFNSNRVTTSIVPEVNISANPLLTNLDGLEGVTQTNQLILRNNSLTNINGLRNLTHIGGLVDFSNNLFTHFDLPALEFLGTYPTNNVSAFASGASRNSIIEFSNRIFNAGDLNRPLTGAALTELLGWSYLLSVTPDTSPDSEVADSESVSYYYYRERSDMTATINDELTNRINSGWAVHSIDVDGSYTTILFRRNVLPITDYISSSVDSTF